MDIHNNISSARAVIILKVNLWLVNSKVTSSVDSLHRLVAFYCSDQNHFVVDDSVEYILAHSIDIVNCWSVQSRFMFAIGATEGII